MQSILYKFLIPTLEIIYRENSPMGRIDHGSSINQT